MSENHSASLKRGINWSEFIIAYVLGKLVDAVLKVVYRNFRAMEFTRARRADLSILGVSYAGWAVLGFTVIVVTTVNAMLNLSLFSLVGLGIYFQTLIGAALMIGLPGAALNLLARRWDSKHWVATLTEGLTSGTSHRPQIKRAESGRQA